VLAWAHGTVGIQTGCAPSLLGNPFGYVPALKQVLAQGWIYVATDYVGMGTKGPHPYLIGQGEGRSVLDSVRALRQLKEVSAGDRTVVWGHSQGGGAALWTGIIAPRYAPDVNLAGIVAIAPVADVPAMVKGVHRTLAGRIVNSYLVRAFSQAYPDVHFDDYVRPGARWLARDIAGRCLAGPKAIPSLIMGMLLSPSIYSVDPVSGPLGDRLTENVPSAHIDAALLIAQGQTDEMVLPSDQGKFAEAQCSRNQQFEYHTYAGQDHLSIVRADSPFIGDLLRWTSDRFAGVAQQPGCHIIRS
jgi:pimeloyl-ACP methyl ester carboxylesterase